MSRNAAAFWSVLLLCAVSYPDIARAQDEVDARVEDMIARQKEAFSMPSVRERCPQGAPGEIVVCAQDDSQFRAMGTSDLDPKSDAALNDGLPRAPDFSGGPCDPKHVGCITGGWAPPPIYIIDLEAIPEPPPGSDADLIARGLKRAR